MSHPVQALRSRPETRDPEGARSDMITPVGFEGSIDIKHRQEALCPWQHLRGGAVAMVARRRQMKSISPHTCLLGAGRRGARGRQDVSAKTRAAKTRSAGGGRGAGETPEDDEDDRGTWMYSGRCRHHAWGCAEPSGQDWVGQAD